MFNPESLREFLERNAIQQCRFGKLCGQVSPSTISTVVNGWRPIGPALEKKIKQAMRELKASEQDIAEVFKN